MILHDFQCPSGHLTEQFVNSTDHQVPCPYCKQPARRVYLRAPRLDWSGMAQGANAGPEFVDRFTKVHQAETVRQEKILREHGDYGPGHAPPPKAQ
jgi:hypothetical protein